MHNNINTFSLLSTSAAVQHERAPKMSNASASGAINYHSSSFYANQRYADGIFAFPMHFSQPLAFPFDNYHLTATPYYPHLAESLNIKLNQSIYRAPTTANNFDHHHGEIEKIMANNFLPRVPNVKEEENIEKCAKENEVTSSAEEVAQIDINRLKSTQSLYDSASKILFLAIRWAKSIPSFNQLPSSEQKKLLNECWPELFIIAAAQWGLAIDDEMTSSSSYLKQLQSFVRHFINMKIDHFEAACLKALVLFRGTSIEDQSIVQQLLLLQNQTLCLLIEKCGSLRLGHLLLLLPQTKTIGNSQSLQVSLNKKFCSRKFS